MLEADQPPPQQNDASFAPTSKQIFYDALDILNKKTD